MDDVPGAAKTVPMMNKWENAYAELMQDATVGRLFRGIVHNLNGAVQTFSLQSELFEMMFRQADQFFDQIFHGTDSEKERALENLYALLQKRAGLVEQMNEKISLCQKVMQRSISLHPAPDTPHSGQYLLAGFIREEVDFLCADSFFKHKVGKEIVLEEDLTISYSSLRCLRLALQPVLHNALESLKKLAERPLLKVTSKKYDERIAVEITDNGPGFPEDIREKMFSAFFSTKENHAGLGLYMARKSMEQLGGTITASPRQGGATFLLQFCSIDPSFSKNGKE